MLRLLIVTLLAPLHLGCRGNAQWEYRVVYVLAEDDDGAAGRNGPDAEHYTTANPTDAELNALGADGWELVSTYLELETAFPNFGDANYVTGLQPNVRPQRLVLLFKRPARGGSDAASAEGTPAGEEGSDLLAYALDELDALVADSATFVSAYSPYGGLATYRIVRPVQALSRPRSGGVAATIPAGREFSDANRVELHVLESGTVRVTAPDHELGATTTSYGQVHRIGTGSPSTHGPFPFRVGQTLEYLFGDPGWVMTLRDTDGAVYATLCPCTVEREPEVQEWVNAAAEGEPAAWVLVDGESVVLADVAEGGVD